MKMKSCCYLFFLLNYLFVLIDCQVCSEVFPHLTCGLSYNTQEECEAVGCCWDPSSASINNCFSPKINGKFPSLTFFVVFSDPIPFNF